MTVVVGFRARGRRAAVPGAMRARLGGVRAVAASGQDPPDRVRPLCGGQTRKRRGLGKPETFNFLGFTFICGKSRQGKFLLKRKTRRDRMRAKLKRSRRNCDGDMHQPIPEQGEWLRQVVTGFFNYHAVPTNIAHSRRSATMSPALAAHAPAAQPEGPHDMGADQRSSPTNGSPTAHPSSVAKRRFAVKHPRWEPYAGKPHVRICAGGAQ